MGALRATGHSGDDLDLLSLPRGHRDTQQNCAGAEPRSYLDSSERAFCKPAMSQPCNGLLGARCSPSLSSSLLHEANPSPPANADTVGAMPATQKLLETPRTGITWQRAVFTIVKAYVGPSMLYLPRAFMHGGLLFSTVALIATSLGSMFTLHRLLLCRQQYRKPTTYGELMEKALGPSGRYAVNASVVLVQSGICSTYFIFISRILLRTLLPHASLRALMAILPLLLMPLAWIRRVQQLTLPCLVANITVFASLGAILFYEARNQLDMVDLAQAGSDDAQDLAQSLGPVVALGSLIFSFEGTAFIIPLYDAVQEPRHFVPMTLGSLAFVTLVMAVNGAMGFIAFGFQTESIVLMNLPANDFYTGVQLAYALVVVLTFPLQLLPAIRIIEANFFKPRAERPVPMRQKVEKSAFRSAFVLLLAAAAYLGQSSFDHFVSLIGVLCGIPLAFTYPCLCHWAMTTSRRERFVDMIVVLGSIVITVVVTCVNVMLWAKNIAGS